MEQSIETIQHDITTEFSVLDGDLEMTNFYLMELGQKLPPLLPEDQTEENLIKGCQSKVWLAAGMENNKIYYRADSNTAITKGLVALLVRVFSGHSPEEILHADIFFPQSIGMNRFIGTQRSNGFGAMIKQFKLYAIAFKSKLSKP